MGKRITWNGIITITNQRTTKRSAFYGLWYIIMIIGSRPVDWHRKANLYWNEFTKTMHTREIYVSIWRHQMETFSALLALCEGNPSVIPLTNASDVELWCFRYLRLNKRFSKQSIRQWLDTSALIMTSLRCVAILFSWEIYESRMLVSQEQYQMSIF